MRQMLMTMLVIHVTGLSELSSHTWTLKKTGVWPQGVIPVYFWEK